MRLFYNKNRAAWVISRLSSASGLQPGIKITGNTRIDDLAGLSGCHQTQLGITDEKKTAGIYPGDIGGNGRIAQRRTGLSYEGPNLPG